ncbi:hypothetical protein B4U80_10842, partial [Leptotrombidium deliense]
MKIKLNRKRLPVFSLLFVSLVVINILVLRLICYHSNSANDKNHKKPNSETEGFLDGKHSENITRINYNSCKNTTSTLNNHSIINTENIYKDLNFDNPKSEEWEQGWKIKVNESRFVHEKLKVFVVPHSHNDPGWGKTFDEYLADQTRYILNNMLKHMMQNPNMTFIWAETSYFAAWWETLNNTNDKEHVIKLLNNGQLEIVNGGWVMNDEANTHYSAIITQMLE